MKKLLLFVFVIFLAGCATQHVFDVEEANTYLMSHSTRPAHIKEALSAGKLAKGMNEEEVEICWGKPKRIENRAMPDQEIIIWRYFEDRVVAQGRRRMLTRNVLSKEVKFKDGKVISWREFSSPS